MRILGEGHVGDNNLFRNKENINVKLNKEKELRIPI